MLINTPPPMWRFNPRPPLPGSDAWLVCPECACIIVSIHAPRCRGAMPNRIHFAAAHFVVSIHAPRCRGAMPASGHHCRRMFYRFNPRPPLPGSDARCARKTWRHPGCFNPRPPLPGSDAATYRAAILNAIVSIHAPRCRGAMPSHGPSITGTGRFQSTPPVAGERCGTTRTRTWRQKSFNPRPPLPGSDARVHLQSVVLQNSFQSTPPVAGERCNG